jgi:uncharacterized protein (TIGR02145 family)
MKNLYFSLVIFAFFISCKKENTTPNSNPSQTVVTKDTSTVQDTFQDTLKLDTLQAKLISFDCSKVTINGTLVAGQIPNLVKFTINYFGGNGKEFPSLSINSLGVKGLKASLSAGKLLVGSGNLRFYIYGVPESAGVASFEVKWGEVSCTVNMNVKEFHPSSGYGPILKDVSGNSYKTVYIGTQHWMAENLRTSKYNDGTSLTNIQNDNQWWNCLSGAWSNYLNSSENDTIYGKLYNWYVMDKTYNGNRNVCPTGWHIPTENEWWQLSNSLGGFSLAGGAMKENSLNYWSQPNKGASNSSLFRAVPSGFRFDNGSFSSISNSAVWWTSTEFDICNYKVFYLLYNQSDLNNGRNDKRTGNAIRCVKD